MILGAAESGNVDVIRAIIDAGADVNAADKYKQTALTKAIDNNNNIDVEAAGVLIKAGADVNVRDERGETPIMKAVRIGNVKLVRMLLAAGADPKAKNDIDRSAFDHAQMKKNILLEEILRDAEAGKLPDESNKTNEDANQLTAECKALHNNTIRSRSQMKQALAQAVDSGNGEAFLKLLGIENATQDERQKILREAVYKGSHQVVRGLLMLNTEVNTTDAIKRSILMLNTRNPEIVQNHHRCESRRQCRRSFWNFRPHVCCCWRKAE